MLLDKAALTVISNSSSRLLIMAYNGRDPQCVAALRTGPDNDQ